jgi:hypothetical protein
MTPGYPPKEPTFGMVKVGARALRRYQCEGGGRDSMAALTVWHAMWRVAPPLTIDDEMVERTAMMLFALIDHGTWENVKASDQDGYRDMGRQLAIAALGGER